MTAFGWAQTDITPQQPALVQGQKHVRVAERAKDPLTATALAISDEATDAAVIWISCDLCNTPQVLVDAVRQRLAERLPEVASEAVILGATHTHDGPVLEEGAYIHPGGSVMAIADCREQVADRIAEAAVTAWQARQPGLFGSAFGHAVVGHNRRAVYADGHAQMYGKTNRPDFLHIEGYEDHSLDILAIHSPAGELTGLVLAVPCPSQVEEQLCEWSADYWHETRIELRHRFGEHLHILPICSAAGDCSPHFLLYGKQEEEMRRRRGTSERQEIAWRIATGVERAFEGGVPLTETVTVKHAQRCIDLPGRTITQREDDWAAEVYQQDIERGIDPELWWPRRLREVRERFATAQPMPDLPVELHGLRLGELALVSCPVELFLDYGLRIKARSPASQTVVAQLTGARALGAYLPTERGALGGHYSAHPASAPAAGAGGALLVEESLDMIASLFANLTPASAGKKQ